MAITPGGTMKRLAMGSLSKLQRPARADLKKTRQIRLGGAIQNRIPGRVLHEHERDRQQWRNLPQRRPRRDDDHRPGGRLRGPSGSGPASRMSYASSLDT